MTVSDARHTRRIVHMTSVHQPRDMRIFEKECRSLAEAGYSVALVVSADRDQHDDQIDFVVVPPPRHRFERILVTTWHVYRAARQQRAAFYHFHDPELIPVALLLRLSGARVFYDAHEDLGLAIEDKEWLPRWSRPLVKLLADGIERLSVKFLSGVVAATPSIGKKFPKEKTAVVQNFPRRSDNNGTAVKAGSTDNRFIFVGGMTRQRALLEMLDAIAKVAEHDSASLVLVGKFVPASLEAEARRHPGWKYTHFAGWLLPEEARRLMAESRCGLVLYHPIANHISAQPTKLFEYMGVGLPVIGSDFPRWREIVGGVGCGLLVDPTDAMAIAEAMKWMIDNPRLAVEMGERGRKAALDEYNWESQADRLVAFYKQHEPT